MTENRTILSSKLVRQVYGNLILHEHYCPGCDATHQIAVETPFRNGAQWTFDGNNESPTFSPSINVGPGSTMQCHYFITSGMIIYCSDCHHELAGQTVTLPDIPNDWL